MEGLDAVAVITTAITSLGTTLGGVAGPALGIGASVLGLFFGWNIVRRFVS